MSQEMLKQIEGRKLASLSTQSVEVSPAPGSRAPRRAAASRAPCRAAAAKKAVYVELSDDASEPGDGDSDFQLSE